MNNLYNKNLLNIIINHLEKNSSFLDLGCGDGKDSLFMQDLGFKVVSVDITEDNIEKLNMLAKKHPKNIIKTYWCDMLDFKIKENQYDVILLNNSIHFMPRDAAFKIIEEIKEEIKINGFVIISAFTEDDPTAKYENQKNIRFEKQELKKLFKDFKIYYYFEGIVHDNPHVGADLPHDHGMAKIIAQKIKS